MIGSARELAHSARILAAITFHFSDTRLAVLTEVLRSLSEYPVEAMHVVIATNTFNDNELATLRRLCDETVTTGSCSVRSYGDLRHPFDLAWSHKAIIAREFVTENNGRYSHFIYLEDDIRLSFENFSYFVEFREKLRDFGLLPAFIRTEYSASLRGLVASDAFWPVYIPVQSYVVVGDWVFVNMPNPYNPCFILDRELAREYVRSRSFDRDGSLTMCNWGVRERAALGLCLENAPEPYQTRYVVPVSVRTGMATEVARISHLPNNYADDPHSPLGKVRMDALFAGAREAVGIARWGAVAQSKQRHSFGIGKQFRPSEVAAQHPEWGYLYHLVSDHDTILYIDNASRQLRHAPFGIAPWNLVLEVPGSDGAWGRLLTAEDAQSELCQASFASLDGEMCVRSGYGEPDYEVIAFVDGTIAIRKDQLYLAADLDGFARINRRHCHQWERYRLVRADTIEGIGLLRRYSWLSHSDRRIISLEDQPIYFERGQTSEASALAATMAPGAVEHRRSLAFGPVSIPLVGKDQVISIEQSDRGRRDPPIRIDIADGSGGIHGFSRFSPLVHYDIRGDDADYQCLQHSLTSLAERGGYHGPISIRCDRPREVLIQYIPQTFRSGLIVALNSSESASPVLDTLDPGLGALYRPILLCGPDTMFESGVAEMLIDALLDGRVRIVTGYRPGVTVGT
jgi:hypothetical protein